MSRRGLARGGAIRERAAGALGAGIAWTWALLAPPRCGICGGPSAPTLPLCPSCERALAGRSPPPPRIPGVDLAWSALPYEGAARSLVVAIKFARRVGLAAVAAEAIVRSAPPGLLGGTLVPVPPAPLRSRLRGFDPAEELALALAARTSAPLLACLARREGPRQVGRARAARLADPPRVRAIGRVPDDAVLVDDVLTTGATLGACARALRAAGAGRIFAVTFARAGRVAGAPAPAARPETGHAAARLDRPDAGA